MQTIDKLDFAPLSTKASEQDFTKDELVSVSVRPRRSWFLVGAGIAIGGLFLLSGVVGAIVNDRPGDIVQVFLFVGLLFGAPITIIFMAGGWQRQAQLRRMAFANKNGLEFRGSIAGNDNNPSVLFQIGDSRALQNVIMLDDRTQIGEYQYTTGHADNRSRTQYCFLRLELARKVPHILLDSKRNAIFLHGGEFHAQKIKLEGDFPKYFELYAPEGYQTDALQIFTPDVMAKLIDSGANYDFELIDNYLYIFAPNGTFARPETLKLFLQNAAIVAQEFDQQTDHYVDARVIDRAANQIGEQGARLRRKRVVWTALVAVSLFILYALLDMISK